MPQSTKGKESKRLFYYTRNKAITTLIPKTPSNHTLGQGILLVALSWIKSPVSNLEGARLGLNSLRWRGPTSVGSHTVVPPYSGRRTLSPTFTLTGWASQPFPFVPDPTATTVACSTCPWDFCGSSLQFGWYSFQPVLSTRGRNFVKASSAVSCAAAAPTLHSGCKGSPGGRLRTHGKKTKHPYCYLMFLWQVRRV